MAYVITEPCIGTQDMSCVSVCPVDCIDTAKDEEQYFINPSDCIDCDYCLIVCPVDAIFYELNVPFKWRNYIAKNKNFFKST